MIETIPEKVKIFYAGVQYDHYDPKRGPSFEYENFYASLTSLDNFPGTTVVHFPFERILEVGRKKFNEEILETARREKPDVFFAFMYSDEFDPAMLAKLKKEMTTIAWFADDSWRFYNYSKLWARYFSWAVTTYSWMPSLYAHAGQSNVVRSQWAANVSSYKPIPGRSGDTAPDVSFVGAWSRPRARMIARLEAQGIEVAAYGAGWKGGRVSVEERNRIFSSSKINLALNPAPGFCNANSLGRLVARPSLNRIVPDFHFAANFESWLHRGVPQVKARHFEIPACGGFMITGHADDLERFYKPGKEVVLYDDERDLVEKIHHYLAPEHGVERVAIAQAGYERTFREHTYQKRFAEIFRQIGLLKNN